MENNLTKYIVYCTTCIINNKIYIGVHETNTLEFDGYIGNGIYINNPSTYKYSKTKFQYAVNKYGVKNFKRATIATFDNEDEAYLLEAELVNEQFLTRSDVYNMALGGKGNNWNITAIETHQYDSKGNFIKSYRSLRLASLEINRSFRSIWRAVTDKCKCAGYFWTTTKFDKLDLSKMQHYEGLNTIPVFQYSSTGEYDCCYDSIREASRVLGIHSANISDAIKLGTICNNKYFSNVYSPSYSIAKNTEIKSREVHQYKLDGTYIASYKNMAEAKKATGIKSDIYKAIKLGRLAGDFQWSFEKLEKIAPAENKAGRARKVGKFDKDWNLIEEYPTLQACKKANGSGMIHVLNGRDEFAKGYRYKYLS